MFSTTAKLWLEINFAVVSDVSVCLKVKKRSNLSIKN